MLTVHFYVILYCNYNKNMINLSKGIVKHFWLIKKVFSIIHQIDIFKESNVYLPSFLVKNTFFWMCEQLPPDQPLWDS